LVTGGSGSIGSHLVEGLTCLRINGDSILVEKGEKEYEE